MKKFYFGYFLIWLVIVLAFNNKTFFWWEKEIQTEIIEKYEVTVWEIKNSIEVSWSSELIDEQSLRFTREWTITAVHYSDWDQVKKWDIIAEIDNADWVQSVNNAQISLSNAKLNLEQLYKEAEEVQVLQGQNSVASAKAALEQAKTDYENTKNQQEIQLAQKLQSIEMSKKDLESLKNNLAQAESDLELAKKQNENSLNNSIVNKSATVTNIENNFRSNLYNIEQSIETIDYILWVTQENRDKNDAYEMYLGAKDSMTKSQAESSLNRSINLYKDLKSLVDGYDYSWDKETIINIINSFIATYNELEITADNTYKTMEATITSIWSITQAEIDSKKNSMSGIRNDVQNKLTTINQAITTLETLADTELTSMQNESSIAAREESINNQKLAIEKKENDIANSLDDYELTKISHETTLTLKLNDIESKERSVKIAEQNYDDLFKWPTNIDIQKAQNNVKQAELQLQNARKQLENYQLTAPFDWTIRKIDYMVWDKLTNSTDKYVYIENPDTMVITIMLDQIDITNVEVWQKAEITFDSYSDTKFNWHVYSIYTQPTSANWVVSYEVKIIIDDKDKIEKRLLSWMSADVEIFVASKENVLKLKSTAISTKEDWTKYVLIEENWERVEKIITTWIVGNDSTTEILSWLSEWDKVIVIKQEYIKEWYFENLNIDMWWWMWWNQMRWWNMWWWRPF